jgi:DNA-binding transcriptional MerR regulator
MMDKSPDAFRTISEVAEDLDVPQHVLRFWETRFSQIRPLKRGGGRRYYRPDDVDLLRGIRHLLYGEGYTIKGVQRILKEEGPRFVQSIGRGDARAPTRVQVDPGESDEEGAEGEAEAMDTNAGDDEAAMPRGGDPGHLTSFGREGNGDNGSAFGRNDIERLKAALAELTECERVLKTLAASDEPTACDETQG